MATRAKQPWDPAKQQRLAEMLRIKLDPTLSNDKIGGNEGKESASSGVINDLFNLLGRPGHTISGAVYNAVDNDPKTSVAGGITAGLTGHGEHNWADILGKLGVNNRVARSVGGFVGDVALDPLTYVGIKGEGAGLNLTEATAQAAREVSATKLPEHLFEDAVTQRAASLMAENPAHLYATFAGKQITPSFVKPSQLAGVIKDTLTGPEFERSALARAFSRDAELGGYLADKARVYESQSSAAFQGHRDAIAKEFGHLTPDEAQQVTFALEEGTDLSNIVPQRGSNNGLNTLEDYRELARRQFRSLWDDEKAVGLHPEAEPAENYVWKHFRKGAPESHPGLAANAVARVQQRAGRVVSKIDDMTLRQHVQGGSVFEPVTDIGEILQGRAASSYRQIGRANLMNEAANHFGVEMTPDNLQFLKDHDFIPVNSDTLASPVAKRFDKAETKVYMPRPVVKVLNQTERVLTDDQVGGQFLKFYDNITRKWKFMNTMVNPGYWVRNSMSDAMMNFMDGVTNPKYYKQAIDILREQRGHNTNELLGLLSPEAAAAAEEGGSKIIFGAKSPHGITISSNDAWKGFLQGGGKSGDIITNITQELDPAVREGIGNYVNKTVQGASDLAGGAGAKLADANNMREDFFRLAHHLSAVDESVRRGVPYEKAVMDAGQRVRKFNIDYGNLSTFEKKTVRRIVPFYSWMRRNVPLQVELLLTRPGLIAGYAKGNDLMQGLLGTDDGSGDYLIPKWIRDSGPVRVALANNKSSDWIDKMIRGLSGAKQGEAAFVPTISAMTPFGDIQHITQPIQNAIEAGGIRHPAAALVAGTRAAAGDLVNMSTPFIKGPVEYATGENLYTGTKIKNWQDWLVSQVGPGRTVLNANPTGGVNAHALASQLLGLQVQPVTAGRQKGEFRRRQDVITGMSAGMPKTRAAQWKAYLRRTGRSVGA